MIIITDWKPSTETERPTSKAAYELELFIFKIKLPRHFLAKQ